MRAKKQEYMEEFIMMRFKKLITLLTTGFMLMGMIAFFNPAQTFACEDDHVFCEADKISETFEGEISIGLMATMKCPGGFGSTLTSISGACAIKKASGWCLANTTTFSCLFS